MARFSEVGPYNKVGVVGLGVDGLNYWLGYTRIDVPNNQGYLGISQVINGIETVMQEFAIPSTFIQSVFELRFSHKDGNFTLEIRTEVDYSPLHTSISPWPLRGSSVYLSMEWW